MEIKVENGRLLIHRNATICNDYKCNDFVQLVLDVDAKELAKALKPYLDSIPNCECAGDKK